MKTQERIKLLEEERDGELRSATRNFARLKRQVQRTPGRFIRQNMAVSIGVAVAVGAVLAPAPRYEKKSSGNKRSMVMRLAMLAARFVPELKGVLPSAMTEEGAKDAATPEAFTMNGSRHAKGKGGGGIQGVLRGIVADIEWAAILTPILKEVSAKLSGAMHDSAGVQGDHKEEAGVDGKGGEAESAKGAI